MFCMKCGKELKEGHGFCPECQAVMEKYPVKPGTAVHIPVRTEQSAAKKQTARRKEPTPKEQLAIQKKHTRRLIVALVIMSLCFLLTAGALGYMVYQEQVKQTLGKNYTSVIATDGT